MVKLSIFILIAGALLSVVVPWPRHPPRNPCENEYIEGYTRAVVDIKIFSAGTGQIPNSEWAKRAALYRLNKSENQSDGISLGLLPDPKTTLQPLPQ